MKFQGALVKEQGQTFAVVVVKRHVVQSSHQANATINTLGRVFPRMPVVLMAQDTGGVPTYFGRRDIAQLLANISISSIPWKEYTLN